MKIDKNTKFLIVGLGLIGGSYARGLSKAGYEVNAITKDQNSIDYALNEGFIKNGVADIDEALIGQSDIIIFCVYPDTFIEWIEKYQKFIKPGTLISDVTGVKTPIVYKIQDMLQNGIEFIPAHPMAGKEVSGVENSDEKIFRDANYIVTPTSSNSAEAISICIKIGEILEFKRISILTPEKHDETIGYLSQLTHCISIVLMTCRDCEHYTCYTGDSFRDLTRIAKINDKMWSELFLLNKEELVRQMDTFIKEFINLRDFINDENCDEIRKMMQKSTLRRILFDKS